MGWSGPPTLRHLMLWQEWFKLKREEPGPIAEYVMQLTAEVMRITNWLGIRPTSELPKTLEDLRLKYVPSEAPAAHPLPVSSSRKRRRRAAPSHAEKQAAQWSKMKWHAALGGGITVRNPDGTLTLPDGSKVNEAEYNAARSKAP